jgi:CHAT domain-containing protein
MQLVAGNVAAACKTLEDAARMSSDSHIWCDLSAARLELARRRDMPQLVSEALADSHRAIELEPDDPAAYFNRALALDALGVYPLARQAWKDYVNRDTSSAWSDEARARLASLPQAMATAQWDRERVNLERACASGDAAATTAIVRAFPQQARTWGEGPYLTAWAANWNHDRSAAARALDMARCIGRALHNVSGESLLLDAALAVRQNDPVFAQAQVAYRNGRIAYRDGDLRMAARFFKRATSAFEAAHSPMALVAAFYTASTVVDGGDASAALAMLDAVDASRAESYRALHAQITAERALALGRTGRAYEASEATRDALRQFEVLHETENATRERTSVLATLTFSGVPQEAWRLRQRVFADASTCGAANVLESALINAVYDEMIEKRWRSAAALATELSRLSTGSRLLHAEALLWQAFARAKAGHPIDRVLLLRAHHVTSALIDPDLRNEMHDKIQLAEADLVAEQQPERARRLADAVIAYRERASPFLLPSAYVVRARAYRALRDYKLAAADLDHAMACIEQQRTKFRDDLIRDSYVGGDDRMFDEAVSLAAEQHDDERLFRIAEHARARLLTARSAGFEILPLDQVPRHVPSGTAILHLTALSDYSVGTVITAHGWRTARISAGRETIRRSVDDFVQAVLANAADAQSRASQLHDQLLTAFAPELDSVSLLVIVTDKDMAGIPFEALRNRTTGRFVIEDHRIIRAANASAWIARQHDIRPRRNECAVVAGDPSFDSRRFPSLPRLRGARAEAAAVARLYHRSEVLVGDEVSRERLLQLAAGADVIHIAAHAFAGADDSGSAVILLTPHDGDAGLLSLHDIARLRLTKAPVIVLAGCRTAAAIGGHGSTSSLSLAFLAAGGRDVVAALWDVDDGAARELSVMFHRDLSRGISPSAALRNAQLTLMRSRGRGALREWAGFQLYGYE